MVYVSDSPVKLGLVNAGCNRGRTQPKISFIISSFTKFSFLITTDQLLTHHINVTGCFCWQAQAAQFISAHFKDEVHQSSYQADNDDGSNDGTGYHPPYIWTETNEMSTRLVALNKFWHAKRPLKWWKQWLNGAKVCRN